MQTVDAATSRIFFSHKPAADDCSATIVVQDAKGNMSQTQLIVDFRRRK